MKNKLAKRILALGITVFAFISLINFDYELTRGVDTVDINFVEKEFAK